jgi:type II secretory pathway pseudopilin PulG
MKLHRKSKIESREPRDRKTAERREAFISAWWPVCPPRPRTPGGAKRHEDRSTPLRGEAKRRLLDTLSFAFTLIEIMIVVGIIGLIMGLGAPTLYRMFDRKGLSKMVIGVKELCEQARQNAILQGAQAEVVFYPQERRCGLSGGGAPPRAPGHAAAGVTFDDTVMIEMLDVNLREYKDSEVARVRFFPNGTSDEMTLILRSDKNEWRRISLEITTGLVSVDSDPSKWR